MRSCPLAYPAVRHACAIRELGLRVDGKSATTKSSATSSLASDAGARPAINTNTNASGQRAPRLDLLSDGTQHVCVYCDWHDDYGVVETGDPPTRYVFHQVKGHQDVARRLDLERFLRRQNESPRLLQKSPQRSPRK